MSEETFTRWVDPTIEEKDKEIDKLKKENNDLRLLYQRTYKRLFENGNDELARYFQAQIDECPTFYVEPIIDYFQETKRLQKMRLKALETIYKDWNDKSTIPIEQVGVSSDLRVILFKILIEGEDKE